MKRKKWTKIDSTESIHEGECKEEKKNHAKWNKNDSADIITFDIHNK